MKRTPAGYAQLSGRLERRMRIDGWSLRRASKYYHVTPRTAKRVLNRFEPGALVKGKGGKYHLATPRGDSPPQDSEILPPDERDFSDVGDDAMENYGTAIAFIDEHFKGKDVTVRDMNAIINCRFHGGMRGWLRDHIFR